jgi:ABC-2 type transport system permease protein
MGVWSDERRQGTDELLLTIPASDLDIVLGKYLAAVAIYSVSLLFSLFCNFTILRFLSTPGPGPDVGLFLGTYVGYWLVGLAMLAVGMVASFLTPNLTIAYVLGALLNAPLVFAVFANNVAGGEVARTLKEWSIGGQFRDFGRGILSFSGLVYFGMVVAVMLYLSIVLIGRRHWRESEGKLPNYVFYPLLHLGWLASFATFWVVLKERFGPADTFVWLAVVYLLLHAGLLWGWSRLRDRARTQPMDPAVALVHLAVVGGFVIGAVLLQRYVDSPSVLVGAFVVYLLINVGLFFGWLRFAGHATLLPGQFAVRALALVQIEICAVVLFRYYDPRLDVTSEQLSSLSADTVRLLDNLQIERPVRIEAFISPTVPESYVQTRADLLSMLRELDIRGGEKVRVRLNDAERFSDEAARAEERYDITPREVTTMERGSYSREFIFMGVAFTCGLEKVILPFVDRGIPVEYELVRSIATVTQQKRRKVGILETDAQLFGQFNMQAMSSSSDWPVVDELEKQYDVERVDATSPISEEYDVLLAVQPSSLGPEQMDNFIAAVRRGIPTAIFEDPFPFFAGHVPGTTAPRRPPAGMNPMMMRGQPPREKGNRALLWDLLQVDFAETQVVWQDYNPYRRWRRDWPKEFVFVGEGSGAEEPFNDADSASSGLQHMLFPFPGSIRNLNVSDLQFTPLVRTGDQTGKVATDEVVEFSFLGRGDINPRRRQVPTNVPYVLAAHIRGEVGPGGPLGNAGPGFDVGDGSGNGDGNGDGNGHGNGNGGADAQAEASDAAEADDASDTSDPEQEAPEEDASRPKESEINVILVADIDMLTWQFFRLREVGEVPDAGVQFDFDNVTFVLNVLDTLAGDDRFLEIRKRRPKHRTLTRIELNTEEARRETWESIEKLREEYERVEEKEDERLRERIAEMEERMKKEGNLSLVEIANRVGMAQRDGERRKQIKLEQLKQETEKEINRIERDLRRKEDALQRFYKVCAVVFPPIPPLLVAVAVFFTRRVREREGVARSRLRG